VIGIVTTLEPTDAQATNQQMLARSESDPR
jgi:hypothetical protein